MNLAALGSCSWFTDENGMEFRVEGDLLCILLIGEYRCINGPVNTRLIECIQSNHGTRRVVI